uniref:Uncharacterized protein n=1 Tax=Eutreptiella gymnastica TaxID=73025 RepID=A0A7S1NS60_9EUGL|mmetsp:Transcript_73264/g.129131  ORF Transcript_73264/g.129131 Transcript_73264/m.129131 type:complete len:317 (+) Transcript_73264:74-1024(+)
MQPKKNLRSSLKGKGRPRAKAGRVSFCPEVVRITERAPESDEDSDFLDDSRLVEASESGPALAAETTQDLMDEDELGSQDESMAVDDEMEMTEVGGQLLDDSAAPDQSLNGSDMEMTEVGGRFLPDTSRLDQSAHMSFTAAAGRILEESMDLTEALGRLVPEDDPEIRGHKLEELKKRLAQRRDQALRDQETIQHLEAQTQDLRRALRVKHHQFRLSRHVVPLTVQSVTSGRIQIGFQGSESSVSVLFGEQAKSGGPLPVTDVQWHHGSTEDEQLLGRLGVLRTLSKVKHSKQLPFYLQETLCLAYADRKARPGMQ